MSAQPEKESFEDWLARQVEAARKMYERNKRSRSWDDYLLIAGVLGEFVRRKPVAAPQPVVSQPTERTNECMLGSACGQASTFERSDGLRCCDFCHRPVSPAGAPAQTEPDIMELMSHLSDDEVAQWIVLLLKQLGDARSDVVRMAQTKVGERCVHHHEPLAVLEAQALRECPICWKSCAEALQAQLNALAAPAGSPSAVQRPRMELDNHHNALKCPYCNPDGRLVDRASAVPQEPIRALLAEIQKCARQFERFMKAASSERVRHRYESEESFRNKANEQAVMIVARVKRFDAKLFSPSGASNHD